MDDLGFNKIAAAVLGTALAFVGVRTIAEIVVPEDHGFEAVYVPDVQLDTGAAEEEEADPGPSHPDFIAAMDVSRGENVFKKCLSCHNAERGGPNGTGPNLWGVMGREMAAHEGYKYSSALVGRSAVWDWEEMNGFLIKPTTWIPGTAMNYVGLKKWEDRAAVMAYLNSKTDNPIPVPEPVIPDELAAEVESDLAAEPSDDYTRVQADPQERDGLPEGEDTERLPGDFVETGTGQLENIGDSDDSDIDPADLLDPREKEAELGLNSAGEVAPDDPSLMDDAVREAIPGDEPNVELEDGPLSADEVLRRIGG